MADAYAFYSSATYRDVALPRRHDGTRQFQHQTRGRICSRHLGCDYAPCGDLDSDLIRAANHIHALQFVSLARWL